ncbi:hypothetical protein Hanom_Chr16g01519191 [Helianthus anomalus]
MAARACSKKRTCTTTRNGRSSFWAACMHTSIDNFLQSSVRQRRFLSVLLRFGCDCTITRSVINKLVTNIGRHNKSKSKSKSIR